MMPRPDVLSPTLVPGILAITVGIAATESAAVTSSIAPATADSPASVATAAPADAPPPADARAPTPTPTPAPTAAPADTLRYTVLIDGQRAGEEVAIREPAEAGNHERWHVRYELGDESGTADIQAEVLVDAATGLPVRLEVHGTDHRGREASESFGLWRDEHPVAHPVHDPRPPGQDPAAAYRDAEAVWLDRGEERRMPVEGPVLYRPVNQTPTLRAITGRALLAAPDGCLALLPEGRACIEEITRVLLGAGFGPRDPAPDRDPAADRVPARDDEIEVVLYAITGPDLALSYLWLEPDGTFFAELRGWLGVARKGWEGALDWLARVQDPLGPVSCNDPAREPVTHLALPGNPLMALATADGCWVIVSLRPRELEAGLVQAARPGAGANLGAGASLNPGARPKPGGSNTDLSPGAIGLVRRSGGALSLERLVALEVPAYGMALTRDETLLAVAAGDAVAFLDPQSLIEGGPEPILGTLRDGGRPGRFYVSLIPDERHLFVSDERAGTITVVDLNEARESGFTAAAVVGKIPVGRAPIALAFSPDGRFLYTTSQVAPEGLGWPDECTREGVDPASAPTHPAGAVLVIDVERAITDPRDAVVAAAPAGCSPVRLVLSPAGDVAYVTARRSDALLAFDTRRLREDPARALIGRVPVGRAPVGVAMVDRGEKVIVANSNRFDLREGEDSHLTVIDTMRVAAGPPAVLGTIPAGGFPRELHVTADGRTLLVTNWFSRTLQLVDLERLPLEAPPPR